MLVTVVRLRSEGKPRPKEETRVDSGVYGDLEISVSRSRIQGDASRKTYALLFDLTTRRQIGNLHWAVVNRLRGDALIITGSEVTVPVGPGGGSSMMWPQSWWCRIALSTVASIKS